MFWVNYKLNFKLTKNEKFIVTNSVIFWTTMNTIKDINSTKYSNLEYFS